MQFATQVTELAIDALTHFDLVFFWSIASRSALPPLWRWRGLMALRQGFQPRGNASGNVSLSGGPAAHQAIIAFKQ